MRAVGAERAHFTFRYRRPTVDAVFFTDETPYVLMVSRAGVGFVTLNVKRGYRVDTMIHPSSDYWQLREILGIDAGEGDPFKPSDFLQFLDNAGIPTAFKVGSHACAPHHAAARFDDVDEADKVYYLGTIDWVQVADGRGPSEQNLRKSARLLGEAAGTFCREKRISTRWSSVPSERATGAELDLLNQVKVAWPGDPARDLGFSESKRGEM